MSKQLNKSIKSLFVSGVKAASIITATLLASLLCLPGNAADNSKDKETSVLKKDDDLLDQFIKANNYSPYIVFDASNIKMFWVDKSVLAKDGLINIILSQTKKGGNLFTSVPLIIQLANVNEAMDCKISVVSDNSDLSFSISDSKNELISQSNNKQDFLNYNIISSLVHLENTQGKSFKITFQSETAEIIKIKAIVMSFEKNKKSIFLSSPGTLNITKDNSVLTDAKLIDDGSFTVSGKSGTITSRESIFVGNNTFTVSVKIKNTGGTPARINIGYIPYSTDHVRLSNNIFPYKGINKVLKVVECDPSNNTIIVDSYTEWAENCYVERDPNVNLSNIKTVKFLRGRVKEVKKRADGTAEIILTKPVDESLKPGDFIRINATSGSAMNIIGKVLQPGQEEVFTSTVKVDEELEEYSNKAFLKYFYFVKPMIRFAPRDGEENMILISDFNITY